MSGKWRDMYNRDWEIYELFSNAEDALDEAWKKVTYIMDFFQKDVLEIGCGTGKYTKKLAPIVNRLYANDISELMIAKAQEKCRAFNNIEYIHASVENNNLPSHSVDAIFSAWGYPAGDLTFCKALEKELGRIIKTGGQVLLLDNYYEGEFNFLRGKKTQKKYAEEGLGYELVDVVPTIFEFSSVNEAAFVLGYILGEPAQTYVKENNLRTVKDNVAILRKQW